VLDARYVKGMALSSNYRHSVKNNTRWLDVQLIFHLSAQSVITLTFNRCPAGSHGETEVMSDANDGVTQQDTTLVVETHSMEEENVIAEHDNDNGDCDAKSTGGDKCSRATDGDRHTEKHHYGSSPLDLN
jgi:hypothetical protein